MTNDLLDPPWIKAQQQQAQNKELLRQKLEMLQDQKRALEGEIEVVRGLLGEKERFYKWNPDTDGWKNSLTGFHQPQKHKGLTPQQFYDAYILRFTKKATPFQKTSLTYIQSNPDEVIQFIRNRFRGTIKG